MRTKEDWESFYNEKEVLVCGNIVTDGIERLSANSPQNENVQISDSPRVLKDYLVANQDILLEKIKKRISTHHSGPDLARLYFALQEEGLLRGCDVATFHRTLSSEMPNCDLKTVRNLQVAVKKLNDDTSRGKIKDISIERTYIDDIRAYLVNEE